MHPHKPHLREGSHRSIGTWTIEVSMIVFSILFALFLESLHERAKQREFAERALERIVAEIESNAKAIREKLPDHAVELDIFTAFAAHPDKASEVVVPDTISLGIQPPMLSTTAFETAKSTQALTFMDYDKVMAISRAYTAQDRMSWIEDNWMPLYTSPMAFDPKYKSYFFGIQAGVFGSFVNLEKHLLELYDETLARIKTQP
jgi:hypothetical protein